MRLRLAIALVLAALALGATGCLDNEWRENVNLSLSQSTPNSGAADHYQFWTDVGAGSASIGCFTIETRVPDLDCHNFNYDAATMTKKFITAQVVVRCEDCKCATLVDDPCGRTDTGGAILKVHPGDLVGIVTNSQGSGIEFGSDVDVTHATGFFITREPNVDSSPAPSSDQIMRGILVREGTMLSGVLAATSIDNASGSVQIFLNEDDASI